MACGQLRGLPLLVPSNVVGRGGFNTYASGRRLPSWYDAATAGAGGRSLAYGSPELKRIRSRTFPGIAAAMAEQWFT